MNANAWARTAMVLAVLGPVLLAAGPNAAAGQPAKSPASQPVRVELDKDSFWFEKADKDALSPGLTGRVTLAGNSMGWPGIQWLYGTASPGRDKGWDLPLVRLVGRLDKSYANTQRLEVLEFYRQGDTITAGLQFAPDEQRAEPPDQACYFTAALPQDLPPGHYKVVVTFRERQPVAGKADRGQVLTCSLEIGAQGPPKGGTPEDKALEEELLKNAQAPQAESDPWGFAQQEAKRKLAELYERQKDYPKAIATLRGWSVSEPCGNGGEATNLEKQFWIARLRMDADPREKEKVYPELWASLLGRHFLNGVEPVIVQIARLYDQQGDWALLPKHLSEQEAALPAGDARRHSAELLDGLKAQLAFEAASGSASDANLLAMIAGYWTGKEGAYFIRGIDHISSFEFRPLLKHTRGAVLVREATKRGKDFRALAMKKAAEGAPDPILSYALAKTAGKEAAETFVARLAKETDIPAAKNYAFALLVTGRPEAVRAVREAANSGADAPQRAARWAILIREWEPVRQRRPVLD